MRPVDLLQADSEQHESPASLIDFNGYNLVGGQSAEARDPTGSSAGPSTASSGGAGGGSSAGVTASGPSPMDLAEFLAPSSQVASVYEQQQQQQQYIEQQLVAELAALQQQQQGLDNVAQPSDSALAAAAEQYSSAIGPAYQIAGQSDSYGGSGYGADKEQGANNKMPYGLPSKSASKEPSARPLGNPKTVSSPAIDFVTNQLPKSTAIEKLVESLPQTQTPTAFSFSSSKDPAEKGKAIVQKKRNVMRQAEQVARAIIKSINEKFGTNIGDSSDIPFLLSALTPLGFAQNFLTDPALLLSLLNTAEKTYMSDVLPGPAKLAMRPVLNIFRVPNKKRDKANLLNIISYLASGGQAPASTPPKHRQGTGIERKGKSNRK